MTKKTLKAKDIERLENTSAVVLLPIGDAGGGVNIFSPCVVTCDEGACTGTAACVDQACTGTCVATCNQGACTGTECFACQVTCVTNLKEAIAVKIHNGRALE